MCRLQALDQFSSQDRHLRFAAGPRQYAKMRAFCFGEASERNGTNLGVPHLLRIRCGLNPRGGTEPLLANDLNQHSLRTPAVKFPVKNLLPWSEIEFAVSDGDDHLSAHDLTFVVGVGIVLTGPVMGISGRRGVEGRKLLQPATKVFVQSRLVVVNKYRRRNVHRVDQAEAFLYAAFANRRLDLRRDVHEIHPLGDIERQILRVGFHLDRSSLHIACLVNSKSEIRKPLGGIAYPPYSLKAVSRPRVLEAWGNRPAAPATAPLALETPHTPARMTKFTKGNFDLWPNPGPPGPGDHCLPQRSAGFPSSWTNTLSPRAPELSSTNNGRSCRKPNPSWVFPAIAPTNQSRNSFHFFNESPAETQEFRVVANKLAQKSR